MQEVENRKEVQESLREYYRNCELWLPENPQWRHYRYVDLKGRWIKIKDRISSKEKLRKHLMKNTPLNVYHSVSCFLNPSTLGKKPDGIFLFSDFVMDIDNLDKENVKKNYSYLEDKFGSKRLYLNFTGGGYHVIVKNFFNEKIEDRVEREEKCLEEMRKLTRELIEAKLDFDYFLTKNNNIISVSYDTRRPCKHPNTVTKYGNVSEIVDINELDNFEPKKIVDIKLKNRMKLKKFQERLTNAT